MAEILTFIVKCMIATITIAINLALIVIAKATYKSVIMEKEMELKQKSEEVIK